MITGRIQVGEIKTISFDTGASLAGATTLVIRYKKPSGTSGAWLATANGTSIEYTFTAGDLDEAGAWMFQYETVIDGVLDKGHMYQKRVTNSLEVVGGSYGSGGTEYTLTEDGTIVTLADRLLMEVLIRPVAELAALTIGTTDGGEEILEAAAGNILADNTHPITIATYFEDATTLYFGGITSSTTITLYYA